MKKARFPSPGLPKSIQNRPQTYKNAKIEAKSTRKTILEALETDFGPQDSDLGGQDSNVGGQKWRSVIYDEDFWTRSAACARPIAKLESSGYSWSTEKFHTPAILSGCGGFVTLRASRRGGDRESFRENLSKIFHFANFSNAQDALGCRELRVVKISTLNDLWRYQKPQKNENRTSEFWKSVFRHFRLILEELRSNGPQNQVWHKILLQIHPS